MFLIQNLHLSIPIKDSQFTASLWQKAGSRLAFHLICVQILLPFKKSHSSRAEEGRTPAFLRWEHILRILQPEILSPSILEGSSFSPAHYLGSGLPKAGWGLCFPLLALFAFPQQAFAAHLRLKLGILLYFSSLPFHPTSPLSLHFREGVHSTRNHPQQALAAIRLVADTLLARKGKRRRRANARRGKGPRRLRQGIPASTHLAPTPKITHLVMDGDGTIPLQK